MNVCNMIFDVEQCDNFKTNKKDELKDQKLLNSKLSVFFKRFKESFISVFVFLARFS